MKTDDVNGWQEEVAVSIDTCFLDDGIFSRAMPREVQVVQRKKPVVQEKGNWRVPEVLDHHLVMERSN